MAYDYNKYKSTYLGLTDDQRKMWDTKYGNDDYYKQFQADYAKEQNNVYTPTTTQKATTSSYTNTYGDTGGAANATKYTGTGVSGSSDYKYNPNLNSQTLPGSSLLFGNNASSYEANNPGYLEKRNNAIANALYNEGKTDEQAIRNYLNTFDDYRNYDVTGQNNTVQAILNRIGTMGTLAGNKTTGTGNNAYLNETMNNYNESKKGYSELMGGGANYYDNFRDAVDGKLSEAYGIQDLDEFKQRYPSQYESLVKALESVEGVWNATNPEERQMLDGYLQGIIGTGVGAGSDISKLNVLEESVLNKFENSDRVKQDMQNIVKLQTEGKSISEIAKEMGISEDQVQQSILAYNGLDNKLGEYYKLTAEAAKDITEPYDTKMERLQQEKDIALERANRNVERLKEDFDTNMDRQKKQNEINAHNADAIAGRTGLGFSKRGIEGINYVNDQAQQIIDDLTKNYDRNKQEMADGIADIIRNWQWNNEDLTKAMEDALTNAKNNYTSNMLAIQQQYGTVGLQAQQYLAQNVQSFIEQAELIYDNGLKRQQQNLSNLITNVSNLNALAYQDLTLRNAKIQQFQSESMNLNRNQLQSLAQQLGMDTDSYQDLVNYQMQAVANELNGYLPGAGVQFQNQIQSLLDSGYTPTQAINSIMNSQEFKQMQQATNGTQDKWSMSGGIMYNQATGEYIDLNGDEYGTVGDNLYNKRTGQIIKGAGTSGTTGGDKYVSSETVNGKTYGVSLKTYQGLVNFYSKYADENGNIKKGVKGGQCGSFVNDYLQSLGLGRVFKDPIDLKVAAINTEEGYKPQVGDVVVMDSPYAESKKYGHVAIVIGVDGDKITTLESNKKGEREVFSRTINTSMNKNKIHGYYHPDGEGVAADNQVIIDLFNKDNLTSEDKKTIESFGMTLAQFGDAKKQYLEQNKGTGGDEKDTPAYKLARAILNGTADKPAKNSSNYADVSLALDDLVNEEFGGKMPTNGSDLIRWSVIKEKDLDSNTAESIAGTFTSLMNTDSLMNLLEANDIQTGPIISRIAKLNPRNKGRAEIQAQINSMAASIARGFGEKGVLTDADIERYMKTIPNEKMGERAREAVGDLLKITLYRNLMTKLENAAKSGRDVSMYIDDYKTAENFLIEKGIIDKKTGGGRLPQSQGYDLSGYTGRG